ncbi:hypothetical protein [Candidatus Aalborgicola defluviihabitans]|uniref:hypothetical protein n=1 Tax=Candidatus Aalborgicola defluviihabitans TaxID=3386187 RepID=UPI001ECB373A|nr:hypothetical protein [Burkholderiales bacterium]
MRVNTISMKLLLRIEEAGVKDGNIVMNGFAGAMPCETIISPEEALQVMRLGMTLPITKLLLKSFFAKRAVAAGQVK